MRVLWITNCLFEEYFAVKGQSAAFTGGWMRSLALKLKEIEPSLELAVASRVECTSRLEKVESEKFTFYALPGRVARKNYDSSIEPLWKQISDEFRPDVVHIHGSEYPHGLAYVNAVGRDHVLVSIQGIVSRYARYNSGGIKTGQLLKYLTIYDLVRHTSPLDEERHLRKQGVMEEELLRKVSDIVGRTTWDHDHCLAINPEMNYHFCNETLRTPFYADNKWSPDKCRRHRIFLSQAAKPIKGIHRVIEAMPLILRDYPDTEVYVAGANFVDQTSFKQLLKTSAYSRYVKHLINKYDIADRVHFTGMINAEQMAEQYRMANVFICPSSIENSPNSLGEAQLTGCPVVASYVGGVPDMVEHEKTGLLYRFEETEMLAAAVCRIFADDNFAKNMSEKGIEAASKRHDGMTNATSMLEIYKSIARI